MKSAWDWKIAELIKDRNGTLSHTKLWANISSAVITWGFIVTSNSKGSTPELIVAYATVVGLYRLGSKYLDKENTKNDSTVNTTEGS